MNAFYKMYCRTFQAVLKQLIKLMPWRKPELLRFDNGAAGLAGFIKGKGLNSVLVVTDGNLMKLGLCAPMLEALEKEGVKAAVYDKVVANPTIVNVEEALKLYNESVAQGIIAFGGGSPMDCAKGVGARVARDAALPEAVIALRVEETPLGKARALEAVVHVGREDEEYLETFG